MSIDLNNFDINLISGDFCTGKTTLAKNFLKNKSFIEITKNNIIKCIFDIGVDNFTYNYIFIDNINVIGSYMNILLYFIKYRYFKDKKIIIVVNEKLSNDLYDYLSDIKENVNIKQIKLTKKYNDKNIRIVNYAISKNIYKNIYKLIKLKHNNYSNIIIFLSSPNIYKKLLAYISRKTTKKYPIYEISKSNILIGDILVSYNEVKDRYIPNLRYVIDECRIYNSMYDVYSNNLIELYLPISNTKSDNRKGLLYHSMYKDDLVYYTLTDSKTYNLLPDYKLSSMIKNMKEFSSKFLFLLSIEQDNKFEIKKQFIKNGTIDTFIPIFEETLLKAKENLIKFKLINNNFECINYKIGLFSIFSEKIEFIKLFYDYINIDGFIVVWTIIIDKFKHLFPYNFKINLKYIVDSIDNYLSVSESKKIYVFFTDIVNTLTLLELPLTNNYISVKDVIKKYKSVIKLNYIDLYLKKPKGLSNIFETSLLSKVFALNKHSNYKNYIQLYLSADNNDLLIKRD